MKRPEKKKIDITLHGCMTDGEEGYNQAIDEYEAYIKSLGSKIECAVLHEPGCQCENDE